MKYLKGAKFTPGFLDTVPNSMLAIVLPFALFKIVIFLPTYTREKNYCIFVLKKYIGHGIKG